MQGLVDSSGTILSIGECDFVATAGQRVVPLPLTPADDRVVFQQTMRVNLDGTLRTATPDELAAAARASIPPDGRGFERALMAVFPDALQRNGLLIKYPLFLWSLRGEAWSDLKAMLDDAQKTLAITPAQ